MINSNILFHFLPTSCHRGLVELSLLGSLLKILRLQIEMCETLYYVYSNISVQIEIWCVKHCINKVSLNWTSSVWLLQWPNCKMIIFFQSSNVFFQSSNVFVQPSNVFVQSSNVFVQIEKCICIWCVCQPGIGEVLWISSLWTITTDTEAELWRRDLFITLQLRGCSFDKYFSWIFSYF